MEGENLWDRVGPPPPGLFWQNLVNKRVADECVLFTTPPLLKRLMLRVGVYYLPHTLFVAELNAKGPAGSQGPSLYLLS